MLKKVTLKFLVHFFSIHFKVASKLFASVTLTAWSYAFKVVIIMQSHKLVIINKSYNPNILSPELENIKG
jgi:hypothetical protein